MTEFAETALRHMCGIHAAACGCRRRYRTSAMRSAARVALNRRALKAHFAKLDEKAAIQRQHMPPNILGGYQPTYRVLKLGPEKTLDEIRDRVASGIPFNDPDAGQRSLPDQIIPGIDYGRQPVSLSQRMTQPGRLPDDLSIPAFLDRRPKPEERRTRDESDGEAAGWSSSEQDELLKILAVPEPIPGS